MTRTVWKYRIPLRASWEQDMPVGARILHVQMQMGVPVLWALVDPRAPREIRRFINEGTGQTFDGSGLDYVGTWQEENSDGAFVFHLFEVKS